MDNKELLERVSGKLGRSKADVSKLMEAFAEVVKSRCAELDTGVWHI